MGAPLLLSFDLANLDAAQKRVYLNAEIVQINQDADADGRGVRGGRRVGGGNFTEGAQENIWSRQLHGGDVAILFINVGTAPKRIVCGAACLDAAGLVVGNGYGVRDIDLRKALPSIVLQPAGLATVVPGGTGSVLWRLSPM